MNINKNLIQVIEDSVYHKGIFMEIGYAGSKFNVSEEVCKGNIRTSIHSDYLDSHLFLYAFTEMLKEGKVDVRFNNKATEYDMGYLERLSEGIKSE